MVHTEVEFVQLSVFFHFNRTVSKRFCEHSGRTNDMDTKEYPTFRYDTVEVENSLYIRCNLNFSRY